MVVGVVGVVGGYGEGVSGSPEFHTLNFTHRSMALGDPETLGREAGGEGRGCSF